MMAHVEIQYVMTIYVHYMYTILISLFLDTNSLYII